MAKKGSRSSNSPRDDGQTTEQQVVAALEVSMEVRGWTSEIVVYRRPLRLKLAVHVLTGSGRQQRTSLRGGSERS